MERKLFQAAIGLAWLALPLTALKYWTAWDRLPMRIAVHFDANWQPSGWTTKQGALLLALGTTAFLLVIFAIACYAASRKATASLSRWAMVAVFYVALGLVFYMNYWIVDRNFRSSQPAPVMRLILPSDLGVAEKIDPQELAGTLSL
jgi:glucan phosphoethanolaminetransferase (alkaline phosphatase superfamily)